MWWGGGGGGGGGMNILLSYESINGSIRPCVEVSVSVTTETTTKAANRDVNRWTRPVSRKNSASHWSFALVRVRSTYALVRFWEQLSCSNRVGEKVWN